MDRTKDMYISGGSNVYPREIEEIILEHPAISEVSVIGVPDEKWGESGKAVVVLKQGQQVTEKELLAFCQGKMAGYKRPKSVDFVAALPKSPYGKILKREIREWYWKNEDRRVR
jgi:acyl-CoA synthetase (AMP-forming)/AMP-acid ligase II